MELKAHIGYLINRGIVGAFSDRELQIGDEWEAAISKYLHESDIFIALVSESFLNSRYCSVIEMDMALEEYDQRGVK
jgi:hypothetical protein